ncbi:MAG: hypothetical protein J5525_05915 [Lachnospiraceae bacterium]|nr:hypothetical protein [Lachnospiraceae bacterium]
MGESRTKNTVLNLFSSGIRQFLTLVTTFIIRTIFIKNLGADYLGLNGLFTNILSLLALSELGIGTAISFYLYKPIKDGDKNRIKSLMAFYKKCYRMVGITIIIIGILITPFLKLMVNLETEVDVNLYIVFLLYIMNTASSYLLFAYKQSFLLANQQQYKVEKVSSIFCIVQFLFDFISIAILKNYYIYLIGDIIAILIKNLMISFVADRDFPFLKEKKIEAISKDEIRVFFHDIFSVSVFRVGSQLFNATDNIIISIMLGTTIVGYYSNYYLIISYATLFFGMLMKAFTAGIGNVTVTESIEKRYEIYKRIDFIMFFVATIVSVCMCQVFNSFMLLWVGKNDQNYILGQAIIFVLAFDFYINCSCQTPNAFRETSGNFKSGQWLQLFGGVFNIVLSFVLGYIWGLFGIFLATIVSKLLITVTPFIYKIARSVFKKNPMLLIIDYYKKLILRTVIVAATWFICLKIHMTSFLGIVLEILICVVFSLAIISLFYFRSDEYRFLLRKIKVLLTEKRV